MPFNYILIDYCKKHPSEFFWLGDFAVKVENTNIHAAS